MLVKFTANIGSVDAAELGLDFSACLEGRQADINDQAAAKLLVRGLAEPVTVKAVPSKNVTDKQPEKSGSKPFTNKEPN